MMHHQGNSNCLRMAMQTSSSPDPRPKLQASLWRPVPSYVVHTGSHDLSMIVIKLIPHPTHKNKIESKTLWAVFSCRSFASPAHTLYLSDHASSLKVVVVGVSRLASKQTLTSFSSAYKHGSLSRWFFIFFINGSMMLALCLKLACVLATLPVIDVSFSPGSGFSIIKFLKSLRRSRTSFKLSQAFPRPWSPAYTAPSLTDMASYFPLCSKFEPL